jgi:hypothetical protein
VGKPHSGAAFHGAAPFSKLLPRFWIVRTASAALRARHPGLNFELLLTPCSAIVPSNLIFRCELGKPPNYGFSIILRKKGLQNLARAVTGASRSGQRKYGPWNRSHAGLTRRTRQAKSLLQ